MESTPEVDAPDPENGLEISSQEFFYTLERMSLIDTDFPIIGSFRVEKVPSGRDVPQEIREQWVGVDIPVRFPIALNAGGVEFCGEDAFLSLTVAGRTQAARWFARNSQPTFPAWMFGLSEGTLTLADEKEDPMYSLEYYREFFPDEESE